MSRYKVFVKVLFNGKEVSKTESKHVTLLIGLHCGLHCFMTSGVVPEDFSFFAVRRYASMVYAMTLCLSIHLSVASRSFIETTKHSIIKTTQHNSVGTLLKPEILMKFPIVDAKYKSGRKKCYFQRITHHILKMIQDICIVSMKMNGKSYALLSNSDIDDERPNHPRYTPYFVFWIFLHISGIAEAKVFKSYTQLSHIKDDKEPPRWAWSELRDPFLNFGAPVVSLEWLKIGISDLVCKLMYCLQWFDAGGWASGRAFGL